MSLSYMEQEIHISASRNDEYATIYCSDSTWITKMDKLVTKAPDLFSIVVETDVGKTYRFPKKLISIRSSIVTREMTEEQREQAAERLKRARESKCV